MVDFDGQSLLGELEADARTDGDGDDEDGNRTDRGSEDGVSPPVVRHVITRTSLASSHCTSQKNRKVGKVIRLATTNWILLLTLILILCLGFVVEFFVFDVFFDQGLRRIEFFVLAFPFVVLLVVVSEAKILDIFIVLDETLETKSRLEGTLLQRKSKRKINRLRSDVLLIDGIKGLLRGRLDDELVGGLIRREIDAD